MNEKKYIVRFAEVGKEDVGLVGGKGANLGEMVKAGIPVPNGFIVTSKAYFYFIEVNKLKEKIKHELASVDYSDPHSLQKCSARIKKLIVASPIPKEVSQEIMMAYQELSGVFSDPYVAVRSSATAEDLPEASFAGQQETFLNTVGQTDVVLKTRKCWASLFTPRAIFYRHEKGFDNFRVGIAVPIQKMVQSDASGVMFTIDPVKNDKEKIIIEAIYGIGELLVLGVETPDHFVVRKSDLRIIEKSISEQNQMLVKKGKKNIYIKIKKEERRKQKISDNQIKKIAKIGKEIHEHYFFPQDIEWAIEKGKIYIVQTRPVTTMLEKEVKKKSVKIKKGAIEALPLLIEGQGASPGIGIGPTKIIKDIKAINNINLGDVLVTKMTSPDFVPTLKKVSAIVTDEGGRTCHAAIVSRELGIPCVVGTKTATRTLPDSLVVTVDGLAGKVRKGAVSRAGKYIESYKEEKRFDEVIPKKTATKVYVNLAEPELAESISKESVDGVGLLRAEFMMAQIGVHPKKLIAERKQKVFIRAMVSGISKICQAFYPRPVVYRTSDLKTNEYRNLRGGNVYEPIESNPMLGFRGCSRYIADEKVFELELEAIKAVRHKMNLNNLWLMLPFVRTVEELIHVKKIIASAGIFRSPSFQLWIMVEIPSNVILLQDFIKVGIDGVSVGSNDLTMLILGADRDNSEVANVFDERNKAVLWCLERVVKTCKKYKITSSICGQAPSVYPEITEFLVKLGITSISVNPDAILKTRELVYDAEKRLIRG
jgi:pyruvate,water dikinase